MGEACSWTEDYGGPWKYFKRAHDGYEEILGADSEKNLKTEYLLSICLLGSMGVEHKSEFENGILLGTIQMLLGTEHEVILSALNQYGEILRQKGEFGKAREAWEACYVGRNKVLGEFHRDTLGEEA